MEGLEWRPSESMFILAEAEFKVDLEEEFSMGISIRTLPLT